MRNKKVRNVVAILVGLAAFVATLTTTPQQAQAKPGACSRGSFCIWTNINYSGSRFEYSLSKFHAGRNLGIRLSPAIANRGYSFANFTGLNVRLYDASNCARQPWTQVMERGRIVSAQGTNWGGRVSSIQLTPGQTNPC